MGYEVHITRKETFFDEEGDLISLQEWLDYIENDKEMRLDGYAETETPDGILRIEDGSLAGWKNWSKHDVSDGMAWMSHFEGNISSSNPDTEILTKMHAIASKLNAKVQGDEGEVYDSSGHSNWEELKAEGESMRFKDEEQTIASSKKWWQIWK